MVVRGLFASTVATLILFALPNRVSAQKLISAEFRSHTTRSDKDHDTGVFVEVVKSDLNVKIAKVSNADSSPNEFTHYNNSSDHTIRLRLESPDITFDSCKSFKFKVGCRATGSGKWIFTGRVTLRFDDGRSLVANMGEKTLISSGSHYVETGYVGRY